MLPCADVIDLKWLNVEILRELAILTPPRSPLGDLLPAGLRHVSLPRVPRATQGNPRLGLQQVHQTPHAKKSLQLIAFLGSDGAVPIARRESLDLCDCTFGKLPSQDRFGHFRSQISLVRGQHVGKNLGFGE